MSYSKDYRKRTIEYRQTGHSMEATHQVFKVVEKFEMFNRYNSPAVTQSGI